MAATPTTDAYEIAKTVESLNRLTSADTLKIIEDTRAMELGVNSQFLNSEPLFSPQNGLTYFNSDEAIYAEKSLISGLFLIREALIDRRDSEGYHLLHALEHLGNLQLNNSRKGALVTLLLEHGIRLNTPAPQEKRGILGRLRG
jgi:hypothetical protein